MSQSDASASSEMTLFNADQLRWAKCIPVEVPPSKPEEPLLQPIWRDATGEYHYCYFDLIRRHFGRTKIHEDVFTYAGQHDFDFSNWRDLAAGPYFEYRLEKFLRDGWPQ